MHNFSQYSGRNFYGC